MGMTDECTCAMTFIMGEVIRCFLSNDASANIKVYCESCL